MKNTVKKVGFLTSGGDAPGMNAVKGKSKIDSELLRISDLIPI